MKKTANIGVLKSTKDFHRNIIPKLKKITVCYQSKNLPNKMIFDLNELQQSKINLLSV